MEKEQKTSFLKTLFGKKSCCCSFQVEEVTDKEDEDGNSVAQEDENLVNKSEQFSGQAEKKNR